MSFGGSEKSMVREKRGEGNNTPPGCMSAFFQFFDFHHFNLCPHHQHRPSFDQTHYSLRRDKPEGVEAPRNSLESEGNMLTENEDASSLPLIEQVQPQSFIIPAMSIKINTKIDGSSSESSHSPSTKSPNLVARLMGLDLLPLDPHRSPSSSKQNSRNISRSLPETPRTSSERKSDVDNHHRHSLQIIREEVKKNEENRTPSSSHYYAKQIVKQVKENVGKRRVGMDITNRVMKNVAQERRDEHLLGIKVKKSSKHFTKVVEDHESASPSSCSDADVFNENNVTSKKVLGERRHPSSRVASNWTQKQGQKQSHNFRVENRNFTRERFKSSLGKSKRNVDKSYNKKDNFLVGTPLSPRTACSDNKCKKIPMLNDRIPQKLAANVGGSKCGSRFSNNSILIFKKEAAYISSVLDSKDNTFGDSGLEFKHVIEILKYFGIDEDTRVSFIELESKSHPFDDSIFNDFESSFIIANRILFFSLVKEILIGIISQYNNTRKSGGHYGIEIKGSELVKKVCWKIKSYPRAKCEHLQDIDALVGSDLHETTSRFLGDEEEESIVTDIEKDVIDSLVDEFVGSTWTRTGLGHMGQSRD